MASFSSPTTTTTNRISIGIAILGFLYSTAYCDRSNIFSAKVKSVPLQTTTTTTSESPSSFSSLPSSSASSKNSHYQNSFSVPESLLEKFKEHESTHLQNVSSSAHYYVYSGNPGRNTVKPKRKKNYKKNDVQPLLDPAALATYIASSSNNKARQSYGSSGWGWPSSGSSNLDLYSLLGGLSFLGLLVSLFTYLANRNGTAVTVINGRRKRSIDGLVDVDELIGESLPEFLSKLGLGLDNPWWGSKEDVVDKKNVTPFKLE